MSYIRFTDRGVMCDHQGSERCHVLIYGTEMGLGDGMTLKSVRYRAGKRGWKSRRVPSEQGLGVTQDFCPECAPEAMAAPAAGGE